MEKVNKTIFSPKQLTDEADGDKKVVVSKENRYPNRLKVENHLFEELIREILKVIRVVLSVEVYLSIEVIRFVRLVHL